MKKRVLFSQVVGNLSGVMVASEAVDEGIGGSKDSGLHFRIGAFSLSGESWDFLASGLYEVVEAVCAGLESLLEKPDLAFVALLLGDGHNYYQ